MSQIKLKPEWTYVIVCDNCGEPKGVEARTTSDPGGGRSSQHPVYPTGWKRNYVSTSGNNAIFCTSCVRAIDDAMRRRR